MTVGGVRIAALTAMHSNGLDPDYIGGDLDKAAAGAAQALPPQRSVTEIFTIPFG